MEMQIKKISDYGISNPIIARLSVQTSELCNFFIQEKQKKDNILQILGFNVQFKLLECYKIYEEIYKEIISINEEIAKKGFYIQSNGRIITVPNIVRLESRCDTFLYNAKTSLREAVKLLNEFWGTNFTSPRFDKIKKWELDKFGKDDDLYKMLKQDHEIWIYRIIDMRNAVEHPYSDSGAIEYKNMEIVNVDGKYKLSEPVWHFKSEKYSSIINDMVASIDNILRFCEDLLVICLSKLEAPIPVEFYEIPENERDPKMPIRIRITLRRDMPFKSPNRA